MVFGIVSSRSDVIPLFFFSHVLEINRGLHQVLAGGRADLDQENGYGKPVRQEKGLCTMQHKQENPVLAVSEFLRSYHPKHQTTSLLRLKTS